MITEQLDTILADLKQISCLLDNLTEDNFDHQILLINNKINNVNNLRAEILQKYTVNQLQNHTTEINNYAKVVKNKFDNIITDRKAILENSRIKFKGLLNKKKLINYLR